MNAGILLLLAAASRAASVPPAVERSTTAPILIVHPAEKQNLSGPEEWVLGSVSDPKALFTINGTTISVYRTGAFLAWLPVQPGTFTFRAALQMPDGATTVLDRNVTVNVPAVPLPAKPVQIDKDSISPRSDQELRPGDWLVARFKGTPGHKARMRLRKTWEPMRELNPALGIYEGAYLIRESDEDLDPRALEFKLGSASAKSPGKIAVRASAPQIATVRGSGSVNVKTAPGEGEFFPVFGGARLITTGRVGNETKLLLGGGQTGAIETKHLEFMPEGSAPPRAETDAITVKPGSDATTVRVGVSERVPFTVETSDDLMTLTLRLHYTYAHTNWIVYGAADPLVDEVRLKQEVSDIVAVTVRIKPGRRVWGWLASYDGSGIKLELRKPPVLGSKVLQGRTVYIDPGHMPSAPGSTGGLGTKEMDVNYHLARELEARLQKEGVKTIMSRASAEDEVGLSDRPRLAAEKRADLFVSVHNNNIPSARHPFKNPHGYSVFYYHPQSYEFARQVYAAYGKHVPLPGEDLRYGNLLVARMTAMPAILTETAYMTYPEQEEMLLDPVFRGKVATAIVEGMRGFLELERARQKKGAKE